MWAMGSLEGGLGLSPPVEVVDVVVAHGGPVRELLPPLHANGLESQTLGSGSQFCRKKGKNPPRFSQTAPRNGESILVFCLI